jgi:hypothetical protein
MRQTAISGQRCIEAKKKRQVMHAKVDKKETGSGRQGSQDAIGESTAVTIIGC